MTIKRLGFGFILAAGMLWGAENGYNLFQKGLAKERADADPRAAIKIYEQVARENSKDHKLAAQALIRLAECYEKLGDVESRKIFERVVREYGDQKEAVTLARERLGRFEARGLHTPALSTRLLWRFSGTNAALGSPSTDGKYLSFAEFTGKGDVAVRDLSTGVIRRVTNNQRAGWVKPLSAVNEYATDSCLSGDGKRIAFTWHGEREYELRVIDFDGSNQKTIHRNSETEWISPISFSTAGDEVLATVRHGQIAKIVWVPLNGGPLRVLKSMPWNTLGKVTLSRDGRFVAYDLRVKDDSPNRVLFALASDGSRETRLTDGLGTDEVFGWMADGRWILFATNRTGTRELWAVPVENGKTTGPPLAVKPDLGTVFPLGTTSDGSLLYGRYITGGRVHTATVNLEDGRISDSMPLDYRAVPDFGVAISPDGRFLAYVAHHGSERSSRFLVVHDLVNGENREIRPQDLAIQAGGNKWSPDGKSFMVTGHTPKHGPGIYAIDLRAGDVRLLVNRPGMQAVTPDWLDGGKSVIYRARDSGRSERIFVRNLETGVDREIPTGFEGARRINFIVHPDSNQLAFAPEDKGRNRTVYVMTIGGAHHKLYEVQQDQSLILSSWTKDGRRLLFAKANVVSDSRPAWTLLSLSAEGGETRPISLPATGRFHFSIHPNGTRIAYAVTTIDTEVWSLENIGAALSMSR